MGKIHLLIFFVLFYSCCFSQTRQQTNPIDIVSSGEQKTGRTIADESVLWKIAKDYFRSNPFDRQFSDFISHLVNDPTIINRTIYKRTDTSLFYMRGEYSTHKPFFFPAKRMEIIIAESEEKLVDSLPNLDTIITYQLAGYTSGDKDGQKDVKDEFEKFDHKYKKKFIESSSGDIKSGNTINGAINNYFIIDAGIAPLAIAWQKIGSANEHVFVITFRFKVRDNFAVLAVSSNGL